MTLQSDRVALFERLGGCRRILVAGAGGGYDVFAGLPLYHRLRERGAEVFLANLSFTDLELVAGAAPRASHVRVTADSAGPGAYFPEKHLAAWLRDRGEEVVVHAFGSVGVRPLRAAYAGLVDELGIDGIVLVDGGTDSLMRGDEAGLGTPVEDMTSIVAVDGVSVGVKLFASIGFGVDHFHGVCHADVLEAIAALSRAGGYLGAFALVPGMPELAFFRDAVAHVIAAMPDHPSIVSTSILGAAQGDFGDVHRTERTRGSELFINPLMSIYFTFELAAIAQRLLYREWIEDTDSAWDVARRIEAFRKELGATVRSRRPLPL